MENTGFVIPAQAGIQGFGVFDMFKKFSGH